VIEGVRCNRVVAGCGALLLRLTGAHQRDRAGSESVVLKSADAQSNSAFFTGGVHVFLTCAIPVAVNFVSMWPEPDRLIYDLAGRKNRTPSVLAFPETQLPHPRWPAPTPEKRYCKAVSARPKNVRFSIGGDVPSWGECLWPIASRSDPRPRGTLPYDLACYPGFDLTVYDCSPAVAVSLDAAGAR